MTSVNINFIVAQNLFSATPLSAARLLTLGEGENVEMNKLACAGRFVAVTI